MQWFPTTDATFNAAINLWNPTYVESIFIVLFAILLTRKPHHRSKEHSLLSEKYYFMHIMSPNTTRFELTIAKDFSNGWTKKADALRNVKEIEIILIFFKLYLLLQSIIFVVVLVVAGTRLKKFAHFWSTLRSTPQKNHRQH